MKKDTSTNKPILTELTPGTYFWCACGRSNTQPFCDGSHEGSSFEPVKKNISKSGKVAWCNCKLTSEPPFCDGSHSKMLK